MARTKGSRNKSENEIKRILRAFAEDHTEDMIYDIMSSGTASDKLKLLNIVLDRVVPKLSSIEVEQLPQEQQESLTELFLRKHDN